MLEVYYIQLYHWVAREKAIYQDEEDERDRERVLQSFIDLRNHLCLLVFGMENWPGQVHYCHTDRKWSHERYNECP